MTATRWLVLALVLLAACSSAPRRPPELRDEDYPGLLRTPGAMPSDVLWRQHVTARWGEAEAHGFEAALQKQGEVLTLIGLRPVGPPGFVLVMRGEHIEFENRAGDPLPVPPRFILLDVQRTFFPWLAPAGGTLPDGEHAGLVDGERVVERWLGGRLLERRFRRATGPPEGEIVIRFTWDRPDWSAPTSAELDNGWFGYRLTVETLEETLLPQGTGASARATDSRGRGEICADSAERARYGLMMGYAFASRRTR